MCGPAAARRRGVEQCEQSGFIPACRRCRFFGEILIKLFVDKPEPELFLLECAAEPSFRHFFKRVALRKRARLDVEVCVLAGSGEREGPLLSELAGGGMSAAAGFTENDPRG